VAGVSNQYPLHHRTRSFNVEDERHTLARQASQGRLKLTFDGVTFTSVGTTSGIDNNTYYTVHTHTASPAFQKFEHFTRVGGSYDYSNH
jgi:hypothetical protein